MEGRAIARPNLNPARVDAMGWLIASMEGRAIAQPNRLPQLLAGAASKRFNGGPGNCPAEQPTSRRTTVSGESFNGGPGNCPAERTDFYQFDVKTGGNLPVYRLKIYDSAGNPVMVTVGTGMNQRQVAVDNNFVVGGLRNSHSDLLNALPFQPDTAGRYYVSIQGQWGGIAPNRVYTLSVQSDDYPESTDTTAVVEVGGSIRTYIMRTEANASSTNTTDFDWVRVADLVAGTRYRIVWDVACLHEGIIRYLSDPFGSGELQQAISRETDGWCTDLTIEFTPTTGGNYFIHVSARGSDFPEVSRYPFKGVWGTLTVERIS